MQTNVFKYTSSGGFMIKRIIFDIDGTLITGIDFSEYISTALSLYGINDYKKTEIFVSNVDEYENTYSSYDRDLYLNFFSNKLGVKLDYDFLGIFFQQLRYAVPRNPQPIKKMLSGLQKYELVLLSNYFEESQRNRLTEMGINDYFGEYHGEKMIKPNELSYRGSQGIYNPGECLIVGDNKKLDVEIPKSLGFKTLHVNEIGDIKSVTEISPALIDRL